jgi:hypothetical protein
MREKKEGTAILAGNQEKAFDRIEQGYVDKCLKQFVFGAAFHRWYKTLYNAIYSQVLVNGSLTNKIYINRYVRQRCPLSMFLFVIGTEGLLATIKSEISINGIKAQGGNYIKLNAYADDISFLITKSIYKYIIFKVLKR